MKRYTIVIIMCLASLLSRGQDETSVFINYMPSLSLGKTADYTKNFFSMGGHTPFIGFGVGTSYTRQTNYVGIFSLVDNKWQFNISPEAGMRLSLNEGLLVSLKVKYSHSLKAGNFPAMSYLGFGVGVGLN